MVTRVVGACLCVLALAPSTALAQVRAVWLDQPLAAWNTQRGAPPMAPTGSEPVSAIRLRCEWPVISGAAAAVLDRAGWLPFLHLDRRIAVGGLDIVGGTTGATAACAPDKFNLFVFIDNQFAGTLAPAPMLAGRDGVVGAVRVSDGQDITAEFARYADGDSECCPSSRVRVRYRIERAPTAVVVASEIRQVR